MLNKYGEISTCEIDPWIFYSTLDALYMRNFLAFDRYFLREFRISSLQFNKENLIHAGDSKTLNAQPPENSRIYDKISYFQDRCLCFVQVNSYSSDWTYFKCKKRMSQHCEYAFLSKEKTYILGSSKKKLNKVIILITCTRKKKKHDCFALSILNTYVATSHLRLCPV